MFRALQVSSSGYYAWNGRGPSKRKQREARITESVKKFHARSRQIYGYRKVHEDLIQETAHRCSDELVRRIMRRNGLRSKVKRKFVVTTDSGHGYSVAPIHPEHSRRADVALNAGGSAQAKQTVNCGSPLHYHLAGDREPCGTTACMALHFHDYLGAPSWEATGLNEREMTETAESSPLRFLRWLLFSLLATRISQ